jgi:hypothetical protein
MILAAENCRDQSSVATRIWLVFLSWTSPRKSFAFNGSIPLISRRRLAVAGNRFLLKKHKKASLL